MEKDKTRVTADLNTFFGHKPGPAVIGDFEGFFHLNQTLIFLFIIVIKHYYYLLFIILNRCSYVITKQLFSPLYHKELKHMTYVRKHSSLIFQIGALNLR